MCCQNSLQNVVTVIAQFGELISKLEILCCHSVHYRALVIIQGNNSRPPSAHTLMVWKAVTTRAHEHPNMDARLESSAF